MSIFDQLSKNHEAQKDLSDSKIRCVYDGPTFILL